MYDSGNTDVPLAIQCHVRRGMDLLRRRCCLQQLHFTPLVVPATRNNRLMIRPRGAVPLGLRALECSTPLSTAVDPVRIDSACLVRPLRCFTLTSLAQVFVRSCVARTA